MYFTYYDVSSFFEIVYVFPPPIIKRESSISISARNVHIFVIGAVIFQNAYQ